MSTLHPDKWQEISPHLDHALSLPEEEREAWLEGFRAQRPDLADHLKNFLHEHSVFAREHFLDQLPLRPLDRPALAGQAV